MNVVGIIVGAASRARTDEVTMQIALHEVSGDSWRIKGRTLQAPTKICSRSTHEEPHQKYSYLFLIQRDDENLNKQDHSLRI